MEKNEIFANLENTYNDFPMVVMLIGIPGSGKSTVAQKMVEKYHARIYSSDKKRAELYGNEAVQGDPKEVFASLHQDILMALMGEENVIYDATNVRAKNRIAFIESLNRANVKCYKIAYVIPKNVEECYEADEGRERRVGKEIIDRMVAAFEFPQYFEGWNEIIVHGWETSYPEYNVSNDIKLWKQMEVSQDNPWHVETIAKHSMHVAKIIHNELLSDEYKYFQKSIASILVVASKYHDIGKLCSRVYDENGVAHYFNHANVGTYYLLTHIDLVPFAGATVEDVYMFLFLVNYHMKPFQWTTEKAKARWEEVFRKYWYEALMLLHKADMAACEEAAREIKNDT